MAQLTKELTDRLNAISNKLDAISDGFGGLIESIDKMSENIGNLLDELGNKLNEYSVLITNKGQEDFDNSRNQLIAINNQINKIRKGVGTEQLIKINEALHGFLDLFGGSELDPEDLKNKLSDISNYVKSKKT
ncbi:MAG: hypothetical protein ACTSRG_13450 [Candidatus Helarchaeota archaeon]